MFVLLGLVTGVVSAADTTKQSDDSDETEINLHELTDAELEEICTSRGFELVREIDDATGEPISYTHDDYIDAAKECLELEEEMDSFFEDNPELLGDLQAETEAMMKEKEVLEQRLFDTQEKMAKKKFEQAEKVKRGAFVTPENSDEGESNEYLSSLPYGDNEASAGSDSTVGTSPSAGSVGDGPKIEEVQSDEGQGSYGGKEEMADSDKNDSSTEGIESKNTLDDENVESALDAPSDSTDDGPLAFSRFMKETLVEFRDKVEKDLTRVAEIIVPEPLRDPLKQSMATAIRVAKGAGISTASMMKRYLLALLDSVKEVRAADVEGEGDGDDQPSVLKRYLSALLKGVKTARAEAGNTEEKQEEDANIQS